MKKPKKETLKSVTAKFEAWRYFVHNTLQPWQESLLEQLKLIRKGELTNVTHH